MEVFFIKAAQIILILAIIVFLHEGGHFLAAKAFKTRVERFFIFFDVKFAIWKKKIGETVYGIGWLPLGGYVKIAGMIDESLDTEQMKKPPQPWEFRSKPAWQRLIIMLAGIIVNILLAFVIFTILTFKNGETYVDVNKMTRGVMVDSAQMAFGMQPGDIPIAVNGVRYYKLKDISKRALIDGGTVTVKRGNETVDLPVKESDLISMLDYKGGFFMPNYSNKLDTVFGVAKQNGLQKGDRILSINGQPTNGWSQILWDIRKNRNKEINIDYERNGKDANVSLLVPAESPVGIGPDRDLNSVLVRKNYNFLQSIRKGWSQTFSTIRDQVESFSVILKLKGKASKYVAGPIGIAKQLPAKWDWNFFWNFTALLSAWLAFINLLPIPGLDGGHAVFTLYEMITGKKPGDKFMEVMQIVGVVFLFGLMIFIFGNDIFNLFN